MESYKNYKYLEDYKKITAQDIHYSEGFGTEHIFVVLSANHGFVQVTCSAITIKKCV